MRNTETVSNDTELDQLMHDNETIEAGEDPNDTNGDETDATIGQDSTTPPQTSEDVDEEMQNLFKQNKKDKQPEQKSKQVGEDNTTQPSTNATKPVNNGQDLIGPDGKVIAKAGAERRFYEKATRLEQQVQNFNQNVLPQIREQFNSMENQLNAYKQVVDGFKASDLSPQDIQSGFEFVRAWKKNPKDVVKFLLTSLQSSGINVDIEGMQPSINAESIKQMLDAKLEPFVKEREIAEERAKREQEVEQEYTNFMQKYPDSQPHDKTLAFMIRQDPSLTPELAYYKLRNFYLQKGLDFRVPLEVLAQQKQQPNNQVSQPSMPKTPSVGESVVESRQHRVAGVDEGFKDIIHQTMAENGLK